ncbi:MAG: M15 family metallopeptidase [bacterium]|nr:M15 family metallopeptidase [bacterium]
MKKHKKTENDAKRMYWKDQMEKAYTMMMDVRNYPVEECMEALVLLQEAVSGTGVDVVFSTTKISNKYNRLFYLREGLLDDFLKIAQDMNDNDWVLKVEDAFRTLQMQRHLARAEYTFDVILNRVIWESKGTIPSSDFLMRRLTALVATTAKIGTHISGSAIDISVLDMNTRQEIDRGGPYIELSELTPMNSPFVSRKARENRIKITNIMSRNGFTAYPFEFWHYSKGDAYDHYLNKTGRSARYGPVDWDRSTNTLNPVPDPCKPLITLDEIQEHIKKVVERSDLQKTDRSVIY